MSFDYETYDITAKAGEDYTPVTGHLEIQPNSGVSSNSVYITTLRDNVAELPETFGLRIVNIVGKVQITNFGVMEIDGAFDETPLSSLTPTAQTNGWGPVEINKSNGEAAAGDGKSIFLQQRYFSSGLGVHAGSDLSYNIANKGTHFFSSIGVDDEVGDNGSVVFQVYVDGQKKFDSGKMTGASPSDIEVPREIDIDITGASILRLVVTDAGDGKAFDHADWAGAVLKF